ncbi:MAG: magnesium transporter [Actinobacteria bacterium]|nr:magnesium transporter [Actinomycetota bacterium]
MPRLSVVLARFRAVLRREASSLRQGSAALAVALGASLLAGIVLGSITDTLERLPGLLVLIPPVLALRGNIGGTLASRLGTAIHAGTYRPTLSLDGILGQNLAAAFAVSLGLSFAYALLARLAAVAFGVRHAIGVDDFVVISVVGGTIASIAVSAITVWIANLGTRRDWDLDNVAAPVVTAAGDLVTVPSLWLASHLANQPTLTATLAVTCAVSALVAIVGSLRSHRPTLRTIVRESLAVHVLGGVISIVAGVAIEKRLDAFVAFPAVLVLIPPFLAMAGALGGIFSSRVSTKLHLGLVEPARFRLLAVAEDLVLVAALALPTFVALGIAADALGAVAGLTSPGSLEMIEVVLIAGASTCAAMTVIGYLGTVTTYRLGLDPDNFAIPVVTSTLDLLGSVAVVVALVLIGVA